MAAYCFVGKPFLLFLFHRSCSLVWWFLGLKISNSLHALSYFQVREPMPAVFFFLIDVSMNAIQTGATAAACSAITQVITDLPVSSISVCGNCTVWFCFLISVLDSHHLFSVFALKLSIFYFGSFIFSTQVIVRKVLFISLLKEENQFELIARWRASNYSLLGAKNLHRWWNILS